MRVERSLGTVESLLMKRRNNFDVLRLAAASFVIISHSFALLGYAQQPMIGNVTLGNMGVNVFFIVSGFLVAKSWDSHPRASAFLAKRLLRIVPGLAGMALFVTFVIGPAFTTESLREYLLSPLTPAYLLNAMIFPIQYGLPGLFMDNSGVVNGSIWTLPLEFLAYMGLLVAVALGMFKCWVGFILQLAIVAVFACALVFFIRNPELLFLGIKPLWLVKYGAFFYIGATYYIYRHAIRLTDVGALVALAALVVSAFLPGQFVVMLLALPYLVLHLAFLPSRFLSSFGRFGDFSYGMYIYAWPIQQAIIAFSHHEIGLLRLCMYEFPTILLLSIASWHLVERPALKLKKRLGKDRYPVAPLMPASRTQS